MTDPVPGTGSTARAVRHHVVLVVALLALGAVGGWLYGSSSPTTFTSSTSVLINPSAGNPFAPTPSSVRQDQQTSLETEAQVVRSAEVLEAVVADNPELTRVQLQRGLRVSVPGNTQVLDISYTAGDRALAQRVVDAVATTYLANRQQRFEEVNNGRIERLQNQTLRVVKDLRLATASSQVGTQAQRAFQSQLADALRNELVSLRAQRTALENSESPPGSVISPGSAPSAASALTSIVPLVGGGVAGLLLGCLLALGWERLRGAVRSAVEVQTAGLPVVAALPHRGPWSRLVRRSGTEDFDVAVRRVRAHVLDLEPRPDVITVAPAGETGSEGAVAEAVAGSFARAGHRVVLVRTDAPPSTGTLTAEHDGLAELLLHERLSALELLQPSVDPMLSLLPSGHLGPEVRELLDGERLRAAVEPLVEAGNLVVIQSPGAGTVEGEALVGAADLGLVVVHAGRTRSAHVAQLAGRMWKRGTTLAAVVLGPRSRPAGSLVRRPGGGTGDAHAHDPAAEQRVGSVR